MRKPFSPGHRPPTDPRPLGYLLRQAAAAHRLRMERALADLNVTPPQLLVLTLLAANPGQSNADVARAAFLTTPTVTVIVANLERRGAVKRTSHAVHGRVQHLELTAAGHDLLAASRVRAHAVERELEDGVSPEEMQTIRTWLARA